MYIGIDLGGTKTEIIVIAKNSTEFYRKRVHSPQGNYQNTLKMLLNLISEAEAQLGPTDSIGIGIPGALSPETGKIKNANSTWLIGHDLRSDLFSRLNRQIVIANDADCFTLSEATDGSAKEYKCVFGIIMGTGVGGGITINQSLLSGPNAITGEWGHNPLPWLSDQDLKLDCYCGKTACIETFLSGPGFVKHFQHKYNNHHVTCSQDIIALAEQGHEHAKTYFALFMNQLGRALASVINILDPDAIVLGGGLSNIDSIYQHIQESTRPFVFSDTLNTPILKNKHGDSSGVRGAAWLGSAAQNQLRQ